MSKYDIPDDHWSDDSDDSPDEDTEPAVRVGTHFLEIHDERDTLDYNGLVWSFGIDAGTVTHVSVAHYCPGPANPDPMGFRAWDEVPAAVKRELFAALNGDAGIVDTESVDAAAESEWR